MSLRSSGLLAVVNLPGPLAFANLCCGYRLRPIPRCRDGEKSFRKFVSMSINDCSCSRNELIKRPAEIVEKDWFGICRWINTPNGWRTEQKSRLVGGC